MSSYLLADECGVDRILVIFLVVRSYTVAVNECYKMSALVACDVSR